jgi:hypothetical protein
MVLMVLVKKRDRVQSYRFAIFSLSWGWLRPLINLISFAISADMVRKRTGGCRTTAPLEVFFASSCSC